MASSSRVLTGIAGLPACKVPKQELLKYYGKVLRGLSRLPQESKYRTMTEKIINERVKIVEDSEKPEDIEKRIGAGLCEELIEQARHELKCVETMQKYKPWEPLEEKPSANQWKWPPV